ncbi:peptidase M14 [Eubacteriales bacterium OttesenSCG-928-G02]|nr:peptidase M14 [Eubacteriales bacterium OttesenSCG-928-G02]
MKRIYLIFIPFLLILLLTSCKNNSTNSNFSCESDELDLSSAQPNLTSKPEISENNDRSENNQSCMHNNIYNKTIKKLTYNENGLEQTICSDCSEVINEYETKKLTGAVNYTYPEMQDIVFSFFTKYNIPYESIGKSVEGKDIYAYRLGNENAEFHILYHAGIHAREYMNTALLLNLTEYYYLNSENLYNGKPLSEYLENTCIHIIPNANPDGMTISQTMNAGTQVKQILRNRNISEALMSDYFKIWKSNANGVDLNRNFDAEWNSLTVSTTYPFYQQYKGPYAVSEPETKALTDYTLKYNFNATISYHSRGQVIYWKYGKDKKIIEKCKSLCNTVSSVTGYTPITPADAPDAGYKDWAILLGIPSLTVETGIGDAPLSGSEYNKIWDDNLYVFAAVSNWVKNN